MAHKLSQLKVKRNTLSSETRITRDLELKWARKAQIARDKQNARLQDVATGVRESLFSHRKNVIRPEARKAHLADAFLRNVPYELVEQKAWIKNYNHFTVIKFWDDVATLVFRFADKGKFQTRREVIFHLNIWRNAHPGYSTFKTFREKKVGIPLDTLKKYGDVWDAILSNEEAL